MSTMLEFKVQELMVKKAKKLGKKRLTQQNLADALGVARTTARAWMFGELQQLEVGVLLKIADFFECEIQDILEIVRKP